MFFPIHFPYFLFFIVIFNILPDIDLSSRQNDILYLFFMSIMLIIECNK